MAGCFGSDQEDRIKENELLNHLDEGEVLAECYCCGADIYAGEASEFQDDLCKSCHWDMLDEEE